MEEALVEEQQGVSERLEWVGARLDIVTIAGVLDVGGEVVDSYLSGEQVYPEDEGGDGEAGATGGTVRNDGWVCGLWGGV